MNGGKGVEPCAISALVCIRIRDESSFKIYGSVIRQ